MRDTRGDETEIVCIPCGHRKFAGGLTPEEAKAEVEFVGEGKQRRRKPSHGKLKL